MSILIIGSIGLDKIENPFDSTERTLGGSASYLALSSSYFGQDVSLVSIIGNDFPDKYLSLFQQRSIRTHHLQRSNDFPTMHWHGKYGMDMRYHTTELLELNSLIEFNPVLPKECKDREYVAIGGFMPKLQGELIDQLGDCTKMITLDTTRYWIENHREDLLDVLHKVDVLSLDNIEARLLSNEFSIAKAAKKILSYGPRYLIINKEGNGSLLFYDKQVFFSPGLPLLQSFDPTGLCDSFIGGFLGYIAKVDDVSLPSIKRAMIYGSTISSFSTEEFGVRGITNLSEEQIDDRMQEFIEMVQFEINIEND